MTNIAGQGTVNTEGLWRREQTEWSMGAGQMYLDRKADSQETRFYQSKGVDVFSQPLQATLLPDTFRKDSGTAASNILLSRCGPYVVVANNTTAYYALPVTGANAWTTTYSITGFASGTVINSIDSNDTVVYFATTTGIYYATPNGTSSVAAAVYVANDTTTGYTGGYTLVRWANDQLLCSNKNRLYAINPRSSTSIPAIGAVPTTGDFNTTVSKLVPGTLVSGANSVTVTVTVASTANFQAGETVTIAGTGTTMDASFTIGAITSSTVFTVTGPASATSYTYSSGTQPTATVSMVPDLLTTHQNPNWIWSDAASGETQVYFAGYVSNSSGKYSGCIYRSDLLGSSTTTANGVATITSSSITQPFVLDTPVQALPMSPDEYPTALQSYLNYIFIGSNRGIRMAETLSIYDPTATATGDLKSGPLVPNILQPVTLPVTAIVGDGRYVWFAWNNYDTVSTGLGKLDLSTFIAGDPLAPAYASDIMVTGQGIVNSVDWDPANNVPIMAIGGKGVYAPYATNEGGNINVSQYVPSGTLQSGIYSYGIPDPKIPVLFDFGAIAGEGSSVEATITIDPLPVTPQGNNGTVISVGTYATSALEKSEFSIPSGYRGEQFITTIQMNADPTLDTTPILYRWTLKAWPAAVSETEISAVLQLFSVDVVDGLEVFVDPYDSFAWLESLRQSQAIVTYQEGPLTAQVVIDSLDWIPHKRRDNWENGFEGDCVVSMKTIGGYQYSNPYTGTVTATSYVYNEV
jgi:hypothetical protein